MHLFSDNDAFTNDIFETQVNDNVFMNNNNVDCLDRQISIEEVNIAISSLKNGKSASVDSLIPELFKVCHNQLAPMLCKLFKYIFDNNMFPEIWRKGIIVPVHKKGNLNDVNNYRGITLTSIFSKIFSMLIDTRLRKWANDNNVLHDNQFGFVKGKSTVDCIFVLTSIIDKIVKHEKRKLYCSFVD